MRDQDMIERKRKNRRSKKGKRNRNAYRKEKHGRK